MTHNISPAAQQADSSGSSGELKRRGKTRDAFALPKLEARAHCYFKTYLELRMEKSTSPTTKQKYLSKREELIGLTRHVARHVARLAKYLVKFLRNAREKDFFRAESLINKYGEFLERVELFINTINDKLEYIAYVEQHNFKVKFATRLRTARKTAGLTQEEVAERIGVKRSTYGQFEQGRNEPNVSILPALSRELNRPVTWFLSMDDE